MTKKQNLRLSASTDRVAQNTSGREFHNSGDRVVANTHMGNQHLQDYMKATDGAVETFTLNEMTQIA